VSLTAPCNIVILQHPTEQKQALATVPILQGCLSNLTVISGEDLANNLTVIALLENSEDLVVLFPTDQAEHWSLKLAPASTQFQSKIKHKLPKTIIVLDGTWRKAKLIWYKNPWLHRLKSAVITDLPKSEYLIRTSRVHGGVSTLEAIMHSCNYLSCSHEFSILLKPFKAMIDWQVKKMGKEKFHAHYIDSDN
jgi:DTW domain-containing protein YfiP